jgi:hypothetical protein
MRGRLSLRLQQAQAIGSAPALEAEREHDPPVTDDAGDDCDELSREISTSSGGGSLTAYDNAPADHPDRVSAVPRGSARIAEIPFAISNSSAPDAIGLSRSTTRIHSPAAWSLEQTIREPMSRDVPSTPSDRSPRRPQVACPSLRWLRMAWAEESRNACRRIPTQMAASKRICPQPSIFAEFGLTVMVISRMPLY